MRQDTRCQRGDEPPIFQAHHSVMLVPATGEYVALWNHDDRVHYVEIYVDVTTTPDWDGDLVTMVDLDLDVVRLTDGRVVVFDEDEFAEHQVRYGYPANVVESAQRTADWLVEAITARTEPFGGVGARWLAQGLA